jgi:hypothetical protein
MGHAFVDTVDRMGAWGTGLYENDAAREWAERLRHATDGLDFIEDALREVMMSAYIDAAVGERGLVAADVVARIRRSGEGGDLSTYAEDAMAWLKANPHADADMLVMTAQDAVDRVIGEDSELPVIWAQAGDADLAMWHGIVAELEIRLG